MERIASWACRKYVRFLMLGALSSCAFLNLALHAGMGLTYYCSEECMTQVLNGPLHSMDKDIVNHIRDYWVDPPATKGTYKPTFNLENPPWATMGKWGEANKMLIDYFKGMKDGYGTFVEVGAQDGEFMSLTLYLELKKQFKGLLIEPNPIDYPKLRARGRSAYTINACAAPYAGHRRDVLWLRDTPDNLPPILHRIQEGSNRLLQFVSTEDQELGKNVDIQCFNLAAMVKAALGVSYVDVLTISTHGGELDILHNIPMSLKFRVLVLMVPLATSEEWEELAALGKRRGLTPVFDKNNIHILIPSNQVAIEKKG